MVCHWTETGSRHDANIVITQVVIMMTTCGDQSDDKVGITVIFDFIYYSWFSNIRITITIYWYNDFLKGNLFRITVFEIR